MSNTLIYNEITDTEQYSGNLCTQINLLQRNHSICKPDSLTKLPPFRDIIYHKRRPHVGRQIGVHYFLHHPMTG